MGSEAESLWPTLRRVRTLVTGSNGFLGHFLVKRLVEAGHRVDCLVRPDADTSALAGLGARRIIGDVTDPATLAPALEGVETVFHLAGIRRATDREAFMHVNATGTRNVCEAMVASAHARRLVVAGSLAAMGPSTPGRPHVEDDPMRPTEWYGESKAEAERIAFSYRDRLEVSVVRPPRILGPRDRENLAFFKLVAHGWMLEIEDGPRPLSMVDVRDVAELMLLCATHEAAVGEAFFATSSRVITLEELQEICAAELRRDVTRVTLKPRTLKGIARMADVASRVTRRKLPLNRKLARQLVAPAWTCSGKKAETRLGFSARRDLEDSVRESVVWYRAHGWL